MRKPISRAKSAAPEHPLADGHDHPRQSTSKESEAEKKAEYAAPFPPDAPPISAIHRRFGKPDAVYTYFNENDHPLFQIRRWNANTTGADKVLLPLTLWRLPVTGKLEWRTKAPPKPRPLYRLNDIA